MKNRTTARVLAVLAAITASAVLLPAAASAEPIGSIVQLSTFSPTINNTSGGSTAIATNNASGVTVAAWAGSETGTSATLNVAVIGVDGAAGTTAVYQPTSAFWLGAQGTNAPVSIDAGADGGFLATWNNGQNDAAVYGIRIASNGAFIGDAFAISSNVNYVDTETTAAAWSSVDNRYLVTWKTNVSAAFPATPGQKLVGRFFDGAGTALGADFVITDPADQVDDSLDTAFGNGIWVVVGKSYTGGTTHVVASTVRASGVIGPQFSVPGPGGSSSESPSIAYNASLNQFLVVSRSGSTIWVQTLDGTGAIVGAPISIAAVAAGKARVASTGPNGWLLAWHSNGGAQVSGIALNAATVPQGVPALLSAGTGGQNNFRPEVSFSTVTGQAYIVWSRRIAADNATNVVVRAWAVAPGIPLVVAAPPVTPIITPTLAATGVNSFANGALLFGGALALAAGAVLLITRRRHGVV